MNGRRTAGAILLEAVVAMGLLSVCAITMHQGLRQALLNHALAQDYTDARFLLRQVAADRELQPELTESSGSGVFSEPFARFRYDWAVERVDLPKPDFAPDLPAAERQAMLLRFKGYLGRVRVTVQWERGAQSFSVESETLLSPGKLWQPPTAAPGATP